MKLPARKRKEPPEKAGAARTRIQRRAKFPAGSLICSPLPAGSRRPAPEGASRPPRFQPLRLRVGTSRWREKAPIPVLSGSQVNQPPPLAGCSWSRGHSAPKPVRGQRWWSNCALLRRRTRRPSQPPVPRRQKPRPQRGWSRAARRKLGQRPCCLQVWQPLRTRPFRLSHLQGRFLQDRPPGPVQLPPTPA